MGSNKVLDHYYGERIEAYKYESELISSTRVAWKSTSSEWYRIPLANGFYAYKNVASGEVLELYGGESVQAFSANTHVVSHQWKELKVTEGGLASMREQGSEGGIVALQSRASSKLLCHRTNEPVQIVDDDEDESFKKEKAFQ